MLTLYHAQLTRSMRVKWALEELGIDYELKEIDFFSDQRNQPDFRAISPLGRLPVLVVDGTALFESGALVEWLIDIYGNGKFAPARGTPAYGTYLQWMHWTEGTFGQPTNELFDHTIGWPEEKRIPAVLEHANQVAGECLDVLEARLEGRDHIIDTFSGIDIMLQYPLMFMKELNLLGERKNLRNYYDRLTQRPAFQKANADSLAALQEFKKVLGL